MFIPLSLVTFAFCRQFFYVAEICHQLNPGSEFPDDHFRTFTEYYESKYGIRIQNRAQPLLDVDHTSARLNLLTPRSVSGLLEGFSGGCWAGRVWGGCDGVTEGEW